MFSLNPFLRWMWRLLFFLATIAALLKPEYGDSLMFIGVVLISFLRFGFDAHGYSLCLFGLVLKRIPWEGQGIWLRNGRPTGGVMIAKGLNFTLGIVNPVIISEYEKACGAVYRFAKDKARWDDKAKAYCQECEARYLPPESP